MFFYLDFVDKVIMSKAKQILKDITQCQKQQQEHLEQQQYIKKRHEFEVKRFLGVK